MASKKQKKRKNKAKNKKKNQKQNRQRKSGSKKNNKASNEQQPQAQNGTKPSDEKSEKKEDKDGALKKLAKSAGKLVGKGTLKLAANLGSSLLKTAKDGVILASKLGEIQQVVDFTFAAGAKDIRAFAKSALQNFGLSELAALQYANSFGALLKNTGIGQNHMLVMSKNLTALSGDFASFYDLKPDEVFAKLQAGISGDAKPLQDLGIKMSDSALTAYALSKGIQTSYGKMDEAGQMMVRYNYLIENSRNAQMDFTDTQDSFAGQQLLMKENFNQLSGTIMSAALPAITTIYQKINELITGFANSPEKVAKLQEAIRSIGDKAVAAFPVVLDAIKSIGHHVGQVFQFIQGNWGLIEAAILGIVTALLAWKALTFFLFVYEGIMAGIKAGTVAAALAQWGLNAAVLANPMTWLIVGIAAGIGILVGALFYLWRNWDEVSALIVGLWQNKVIPFFNGIGDIFSGIWTGIVDNCKAIWGIIPKAIKMTFYGIINSIISDINGLIGLLNKIPGVNISLIPTFSSKKDNSGTPAPVPMMSGSVAMFAKGGFANQPSIFGEAGPEVAIPLKRTPRSLGLLSQTAAMLGADINGGSGGPTFVFSPVISGGDAGALASAVRAAADDFFEQCDAWWESKRRVSFG